MLIRIIINYTAERYAELLEVAITENDVDFAKSVVNLLIEARKNQRNFLVKFSPNGTRTYFKYVNNKANIQSCASTC